MTKYSERPNTIPWPPIILVSALAVTFLLGRTYPIALPGPLALLGAGLVLIALAIDLTAMVQMARNKTTILPNQKSAALVTSGVFRYSRNPIYLANVIIVIGFGFATLNGWSIVIAPVAAFAMQRLAIEREEEHLRARFGTAFESYSARTRRWL
ncbi:MAG: isoprenylcysteine carboxylmethyltransferase family protein [Pseudomonadota bacterium]